MSKKTKILIAVLIVLAISGNIAIIKHRIDVENRKQEEYIDRINHTMYLQALGLCKDEEIYSGDMKDKRVRFNENELMMRAAYYNGVLGNTGKDVITTDDLKRYYQEYIDGDSTNIVNFCNVITGAEDDCSYNENYDGNSIKKFIAIVNNNLDNTNSYDATPEQMEEAIKKTMSEYETGKYRDAVDSPPEQDDKKNTYQEFIETSPEIQELIDSSPEVDDNH